MTYAYTRTKKVRELRKRRVIFIVALQIEWIQKISIRYGIHIKYATNINRFIVDLFLWCSLEFSNKYTKQKKKYRNNQQSSFRINFDDVCIETNSSTNPIANRTHEKRIHSLYFMITKCVVRYTHKFDFSCRFFMRPTQREWYAECVNKIRRHRLVRCASCFYNVSTFDSSIFK